jgi:hypothetical protein
MHGSHLSKHPRGGGRAEGERDPSIIRDGVPLGGKIRARVRIVSVRGL